MQANATQMASTARDTAVSLFASALFLGQSVGVLLAASLIDHIGSGTVIAMGAAVMIATGIFFAEALRVRNYSMPEN